ncbi:MAG: TrpB-like pyridoxal-phosphate dependent enzyme [Actinobacteria bacterium RBG_13_35_12]|nr:MAG: TrpB-like pyridoxal-phosphate dependent enzyme [Actinobacteria bacterium RBG_13_35_12]
MAQNEKDKKTILTEKEMPRQWYNINPDLPKPLDPPLHPQTGKPLTPDDLSVLFPMALIMQEVSMDRFIEIPEELVNIYRMWRPTPLVRAERLEKYLDTPAKIYFKNESVSPAGSHKPNTAVAQAYYNKKEGTKRLATETGAGQWGSALSFACNIFGLGCTVYMVRVSYDQKPYRKSMMKVWGATVYASPSDLTNAGRNILKEDPNSPGSLGIAISEAVEDAVKSGGDAKYSLGSVLNHVILHQTVVGLETKKQFEKIGEYPDILIGCVGGGSNFGGFSFPFIPDKLSGKKIRIIAVEPIACPSITKGPFAYDYGDTAKTGPIAKMYTLGHDFIPAGIHAGGLRYHGMAPQVSLLCNEKIIEAIALHQNPVFEAAVTFAKTEGIIPAPETAHAIRAAMDEAIKCKETGEEKVIAFNFSGHGHFDLSAYDEYLDGNLEDYEYPTEKIKESLEKLPKV